MITAPSPHLHHTVLVHHVLGLVRDLGAAGALVELRRTRPPLDAEGYHDTLAVYVVWAVDRLVAAGLTDLGVLWHPLTDDRSPLAWWDADTLESAAARRHFVPPTLGEAWEPRPSEPSA
jgi:hypothetical protein